MALIRAYWGHVLVALAAVLWLAQAFLPDEGVGIVTGVVVYLIAWWMVFFTVLPLRVTSQREDGAVVPGSDPGAPTDPRIASKMWLAARITAGIWLVYFVAFEFGLVNTSLLDIARPPGEY